MVQYYLFSQLLAKPVSARPLTHGIPINPDHPEI